MRVFKRDKSGAGLGRTDAFDSDRSISATVIDGNADRGVVDMEVPDPSPISSDETARPEDVHADAASEVLREIEGDAKTGRRARAKVAKEPKAPRDPKAPRLSMKERMAARSAGRGEKAAAKNGPTNPSEDKRLSVRVMIDFLQGVGRDEAVEWAKRWAMTHMDVPSDCFYAVQKYGPKNGGGFAVEVQEGVGRSYLPSVLSQAVENPGRIVVVPMSRRKMTIVYMPRIEEFDSQVLPEGQNPPMVDAAPLEAVRGPAMTPIMKMHRNWLISGIATAGMGMTFLLGSVALYALDPSVRIPPDYTSTETKDLPVLQWNRLQSDATDSYVVRMEYTDGQWRVIRQAVGSTAEVVPSTAAPDAPVVPGVPGTVPGTGPSAPTGVPAPTVAPIPGAPSQIPPPAGVVGSN